MTAISGFFLHRVTDVLNARSRSKLARMLRIITSKTCGNDSCLSYLKVDSDGKVDHKFFDGKPTELWKSQLNDFEISEYDVACLVFSNDENRDWNKHNNVYSASIKDQNLAGMNPAETLNKKKLIEGLREVQENAKGDFNLVSLFVDEPSSTSDPHKGRVLLYRGTVPFYVAYSYEFGAFLFTTNTEGINFLTRDDRLKLQPWLPLDLEPYDSYELTEQNLRNYTQQVEFESPCCDLLEEAVKSKSLLFSIDENILINSKDDTPYYYCPYCGKQLENKDLENKDEHL